MLYACEKCKKLYKTPEEVQQCEANHEEERLESEYVLAYGQTTPSGFRWLFL